MPTGSRIHPAVNASPPPFPIKPRGVAKADVYRELARLDAGADVLERAALRARFEKRDFVDLLAEEAAKPDTEKLSHADRAALLLRQAAHLDYICARHDPALADHLTETYAATLEPEQRQALVTRILDEQSRELIEAMLSLHGVATPAEQKQLARLRAVYLQAIAPQRQTAFGEAWVGAELEHDTPLEYPPRIEQEAIEILRRRRKRERKEAASFRKQLGKLPQQDPDTQAKTIADWQRNRGNRSTETPSGPEKWADVAARQGNTPPTNQAPRPRARIAK